jgi:HD-GYP domain-containing protein (c-di-GMP phosphodiesterase class II)
MTSYDYQEALKNAAKSMVRVKDPKRLLKMMVRFIDREVGLTHASILIYDEDKARYIFVDSKGSLKLPVGLIRLDETNPLICWFAQKEPKLKIKKDYLSARTISEWLNNPKFMNGQAEGQALRPRLVQLKNVMNMLKVAVCIPGFYNKQLLGVLLLGDKKTGDVFTKAEYSFFQTLANDASMTLKSASFQADVVMKNVQLEKQKKQLERHLKEIETLRKKEQETYYEIVMSLAQEVYEKDPYTSGHLEGVQRLGIMTAEEMGFDLSRRKKDVLVAALHLHDVGKIGIPDHILKKPSALTDDEWKIMRLHPEKGAKILAPLSGFKEVANAVLCHHERYDGTGYPQGLKGDEIPMESRIISVVDAFHAIISTRCYKKGHPLETGYRELEKGAGTQFDPKVVEAFIRAHKRLMAKQGKSKVDKRAVA